MIVRLATQYEVPLCADPSSSRLAYKLQAHLRHIHLVVPNEVEAAALSNLDFSGFDPDASLEVAMVLMRSGVETVIVTLSDFGLVYSTSDETGYIPAQFNEMIDSTGTGDSVTAAVMFGMVNDLPITEAIRLGAAAASLTLQTGDTVVPDLSLDMLYDHLIV
jgi:pseudouridine kinase